MREIIKSAISFSLALPLFGVKQLSNLLTRKASEQARSRMASALDTVAHETQRQLGATMQGLYKGGDTVQRKVVDLAFSSLPQGATQSETSQTTSSPLAAETPVQSGKLDTTTVIVMGEGLAAGIGDFGVSEEFQRVSFPAQIARQMQTSFPQPLMQAPGIGDIVGFSQLPVRIPAIMQTTTLVDFPPTTAIQNLSVPGFRVSDAVNCRPLEPLVHRNSAKQTAANLILGLPDLIHEDGQPLPTQLELALQRTPTFTIVELGYYDVLEAAVTRNPRLLPDIPTFREDYGRVVSALRASGSQVLVLTIPDPTDTAFFSPIESAAHLLKVQPSALSHAYRLNPGDRITVNGLMEIGCQLMTGHIKPLLDNAVMEASWIEQVSSHVAALNDALLTLAREYQALEYDLHGFFRRVREIGLSLGSRRLSAEFLGGFYELNGYYPGPTGHALIANEILRLLNRTYEANFSPVDVGIVLSTDPVADYRQPEGPVLNAENLAQLFDMTPPEPSSEPVDTTSVNAATASTGPSDREEYPLEEHIPSLPLTLPSSLEQIIPLDTEASYFGDAIRAVHCRDDEEAKWGSGRELLFGGLALTDSHLKGTLRIKFTTPVNDMTHFEVRCEDGLIGDDGLLAAPQFFKLPACHNSVKDDSELVSSGDLDLTTGKVTNLACHFRFMNTALLSLVRTNPKFPDVPISFPGKYGSAWARFEQRPDGKLDFTFSGTTFIPLGMVLTDTVRFPLPFCSPTLQFATIPARGTQLHPHIHLSTKAPEPATGNALPDIPTNTIQEFTVYTHNTSFGDKFSLNAPEFGGDATGRSHLTGRVEIQFGERFGDAVPIVVSCFAPGGLFYSPNPPPSLLTESFPGRLYGGHQGHNEFLRFPQQTYALTDVYCLDDPFDLSVGAVNLRTGRLINELLHRGLIGQDVFMALLVVEPRTPRESFQFRGPALFEKDAKWQTIFRFKGQVTIPYPEGYLFPAPDLKNGFVIGPNSSLDPFLWFQAMHHSDEVHVVKKGGRDNVEASTGDRFSYRYEIPSEAGHKASFTYINHTHEATFTMHRLAWVNFTNSRTSTVKAGQYDTVTFTGFGSWSKDETPVPRLATVQVSTSQKSPYVSIQIDGGFVSNVNTKPAQIEDARP